MPLARILWSSSRSSRATDCPHMTETRLSAVTLGRTPTCSYATGRLASSLRTRENPPRSTISWSAETRQIYPRVGRVECTFFFVTPNCRRTRDSDPTPAIHPEGDRGANVIPRVQPRSEICGNTHAELRTESGQRHEVGKVWREVAGSADRSEIGRALSRASVDWLTFAGRGGPRRCGRDREGVVQPRVQDSHPRRQCHLARGRGATREPIAGTLSSPYAQSTPGQGKLFSSGILRSESQFANETAKCASTGMKSIGETIYINSYR